MLEKDGKQDTGINCEDYTTDRTQISKQRNRKEIHFSCYAHEHPSIYSETMNTNNNTEQSDRGVTKQEKRM